METKLESPSNPRMNNPDGMYASEARLEDYFSLRDYYAGIAMSGMVGNSGMYDVITNVSLQNLATESYMIADAMLKARCETKK